MNLDSPPLMRGSHLGKARNRLGCWTNVFIETTGLSGRSLAQCLGTAGEGCDIIVLGGAVTEP